MGLLNKIKGIFVEEVYEDEEDEEYKNAKERLKEKDRERIQVAKKIETPKEHERQRTPEEIISETNAMNDEEDSLEEDDKTKEFERKDPFVETGFRFPIDVDDNDFQSNEIEEEPVKEEETVIEEPIVEEEPEIKEEPLLYHERRVDREVEYSSYFTTPEKKEPYEPKDAKKGFQRSPIISPVYGILDKNYRKEEIVSKKEIRLMTNNQKADLDLVREKAYGELASDITESVYEKVEEVREEKVEDKQEEKDNVLYDLSDNESPSVKDVTVGDAEEYFNDLGLEYNVDYKVEKEEPSIKNEDIEKKEEVKQEDSSDEENLLDLIDAMYEAK